MVSSALNGLSEKQDRQSGQNEKYTRKGKPEQKQLSGHEDEFTELGDLSALYEGLATHVRQHVNPLSRELQVPTPAPQWDKYFEDPTLPLQIDVGCGSGRFVLIRAKRLASALIEAQRDIDSTDLDVSSMTPVGPALANVLGLEIRQKLVQRAQTWADRLGLKNCRFIFTNATVSWKSLLQSYPGPVELVSMQFPDPHFKKRHYKRRHVQPQLVKEIAESLALGARVFLQGDVPEAVRWMRDMFELHGGGRFSIAPECRNQPGLFHDEWETPLDHEDATDIEEPVMEDAEGPLITLPRARTSSVDSLCEALSCYAMRSVTKKTQSSNPLLWSSDASLGWLPSNPLHVSTEREVYVSKVQAPVYRVMLMRSDCSEIA